MFTRRNATWCPETIHLKIIDISNPNDPALISHHSMQHHMAVGVDGNLVFLCEGKIVLKVFDVSNESEIILLEHVASMHAFDVIASNGMLIVTGDDGVFHYRYGSAGETIELLSKIPVRRAVQ